MVAPADVICRLGDGPEDSEFEDFEDELDVKSMPLHMYNLLYNFLGSFYCPRWLLARWVGTPANFDSLLPDRDLIQKLHNKLSNVHNSNDNVLKVVRKVRQLDTRRTAQLAVGGLVTGQVL